MLAQIVEQVFLVRQLQRSRRGLELAFMKTMIALDSWTIHLKCSTASSLWTIRMSNLNQNRVLAVDAAVDDDRNLTAARTPRRALIHATQTMIATSKTKIPTNWLARTAGSRRGKMRLERSSQQIWKTIKGTNLKIAVPADAVLDAIVKPGFGFSHLKRFVSGLPGQMAGMYKTVLLYSFPCITSFRKAL